MPILDLLRRNYRLMIVLFVLGYSAIYAFAFVGMYFVEHPYHSSSRWMLDNFKDDVRILGPHWDDRLPAGVPEHRRPPSVFNSEGRENELPLYEPDTRAKLDLVVQRAANADYIVFATPRMADSIPRVPNEYPHTTAFLRLLWGEKLGYQLVRTFKNRPSFLGITFNDDLADESFSVYDHPKVTIFQNMDRLSAEAMRGRIVDFEEQGPTPSMDEMLLMDEGGWQPKPSWGLQDRVVPFVCAVAYIQLIGFAFWGLFGSRFGFMRDRALGLSPLFGLVGSAGACWLLARFGISPVSKLSGYVVVSLLAFSAFVTLVTSSEVRQKLGDAWRAHGVRVQLAFAAGVLVVLLVWLADPQFISLSQQVEGSYLEYFTRNQSVPPVDMLSPDRAVSVFYFDQFVLGWFLKGIGVTGRIGLQVCMVLIGGVLGSAAYSITSSLIARRKLAASVSLVLTIPLVLLALMGREAREHAPSVELDQLSPDQARAVKWLSTSVKGAPVAVDACIAAPSSGLPRAAGLPAFQRISSQAQADGAGSDSGLCAIKEAAALFRSMMEHGAVLYVASGEPNGGAPEAAALESEMESRPDLFAKIYERGGTKVFAPAFSDLYRKGAKL